MADPRTPILGLPLIAAAQAQKHVTVNEALLRLDLLFQLAVLDRHLTAPPVDPEAGDRYIVAAGASGDWDDHDNHIAGWVDGAWLFLEPGLGWTTFVDDESTVLCWDGTAWVSPFDYGALQNLSRLGVGTEADETNPFAAKLNSALWTALTVGEGGTGHLRYVMNKEGAAKTLSLLFQSGYEGRAEIGLIGDDDLTVKVSADGETWHEAFSIDRATGEVSFPNTPVVTGGGSITISTSDPTGGADGDLWFKVPA